MWLSSLYADLILTTGGLYATNSMASSLYTRFSMRNELMHMAQEHAEKNEIRSVYFKNRYYAKAIVLHSPQGDPSRLDIEVIAILDTRSCSAMIAIAFCKPEGKNNQVMRSNVIKKMKKEVSAVGLSTREDNIAAALAIQFIMNAMDEERGGGTINQASSSSSSLLQKKKEWLQAMQEWSKSKTNNAAENDGPTGTMDATRPLFQTETTTTTTTTNTTTTNTNKEEIGAQILSFLFKDILKQNSFQIPFELQEGDDFWPTSNRKRITVLNADLVSTFSINVAAPS